MNFLAHLVAARARRPELASSPRFLLGAMLPDLASMCGTRIERAEDPDLIAGIAEHHRADARFHAGETFIRLYADAAAELKACAVARGSARAAAHLGIELLLDGCFVDEPATMAFRAAIASAPTASFSCPDQDAERRVAELLQRWADADRPFAPNDPDATAQRLTRILARRPRLALAASAEPVVRRWIAAARDRVAASAQALIAPALV